MQDISLEKIGDKEVREALSVVKDVFSNAPFLQGDWKFFEISFNTNGTYKIAHSMSFTPKDVLTTSTVGGTITWEYANFNGTYIEITIAGIVSGTPCVVRAFVGSYPNEVTR